jgi:hypothetical protein
MTDQPAEAERCYRRAYAIATAALEPDHPFVITSRKNLTDFCEARGRALEAVTPVPAAAPKPLVTASQPDSRWQKLIERGRRELANERWQAVIPRSERPFTIVVWTLCVLVLLLVIVTKPWNRSAAPLAQAVNASPAPAAPPIALEPAQPPLAAAPPVVAAVPPATRTRPPIGNSGRTVSARTPMPSARNQPLVETAALCKTLSTRTAPDWRCDPAGRVVDSGAIYFYTRIKAPGATTVEHRWYKDNTLFQSVELDIQPNARNGYRTYSRHTVKDGSHGSWRVELRTDNGQLLHEERFTIR